MEYIDEGKHRKPVGDVVPPIEITPRRAVNKPCTSIRVFRRRPKGHERIPTVFFPELFSHKLAEKNKRLSRRFDNGKTPGKTTRVYPTCPRVIAFLGCSEKP